MQLKVFISYRRLDTGWAAERLYNAFRSVLPRNNIFFDIDRIPPGADFEQFYIESVGRCDVFLALIGPGWVSAADPQTGAKRLDDPADPVRNEVSAALKNSKVTVIPVFLDGATPPHEEQLPPDLRPLLRRNAEFINTANFEQAAPVLFQKIGLPAPRMRHALSDFENSISGMNYQTIGLVALVFGFFASVADTAGLNGLEVGGGDVPVPLIRFKDLAYAFAFTLMVGSLTRAWSFRLLGLFVGIYVLQAIGSAVLLERHFVSLADTANVVGVACSIILLLEWLYSTLFFTSRNGFFRKIWVLGLVAGVGLLQGLVSTYSVFGITFDPAFHFSEGFALATTMLLLTYGLRNDQQYAIARPL